MRKFDDDPIAELERLDAFLDGSEPGEIPIDVLRERGIEIPDEATLDDEAIHEKLWEVVRAMAEIGLFLEDTDHLSDRELYRFLVADALIQEECLPLNPASGGWHISPIGGCSEEDNEIYLRYYAEDSIRKDWGEDFGEPIPEKETRPFDRDRMLPAHGHEVDSEN